MTEIRVQRVIVNEIPASCGECPLMIYEDSVVPICTGLPKSIREIQGNPYAMLYRRSDCVLDVDNTKL